MIINKYVFASLMLFGCLVKAQDFLSDSGKPGQQLNRIGFKGNWGILHSENTDPAESKKVASKQLNANFYVPIHQLGDTTYSVMGKAQHLTFNKISDAGSFSAPNELADYELGAVWNYQETEDKTWVVAITYGSVSDKPFEKDVTAIGATLTRKKMTSATTTWLYFLNYSNNRAFLNNIPLPGFAYTFRSKLGTSGGAIGLPFFSYWYAPTKKIFGSVFVLVPSVFKLQAGYMVWGPLQLNAKLDWVPQVYMRHNRSDRDERLFYNSNKAALSLKAIFSRNTNIELEFGRSFNRSLFDGNSVFDRNSDRKNLPDEWQGSLALQFAF